jgi:hypothetical protein
MVTGWAGDSTLELTSPGGREQLEALAESAQVCGRHAGKETGKLFKRICFCNTGHGKVCVSATELCKHNFLQNNHSTVMNCCYLVGGEVASGAVINREVDVKLEHLQLLGQ